MVKAVFLDRDGVLNRSILKNGKPHAPRLLEEFELLDGAAAAAHELFGAGFLLFVVTNQPDIGNGLVSSATVDLMHKKLMDKLPIKKIYLCPHRQDEGCDCRKPKPGMLLAAQKEFGVYMNSSFMVGDRYTDMLAANAAGCTPIFIDYKYIETPRFDVSMRAGSLLEAAHYILKGSNYGRR